LQWPLDVFGIIAARDTVDFNRNIIFSGTRDNCQTLAKEVHSVPFACRTHAELHCFVLTDCAAQCSSFVHSRLRLFYLSNVVACRIEI
jgi:hypothetical protein